MLIINRTLHILCYSFQQIAYLDEKCNAMQSDIEQHITTQENYERQIALLNQSVANAELKLHECNQEKVCLIFLIVDDDNDDDDDDDDDDEDVVIVISNFDASCGK